MSFSRLSAVVRCADDYRRGKDRFLQRQAYLPRANTYDDRLRCDDARAARGASRQDEQQQQGNDRTKLLPLLCVHMGIVTRRVVMRTKE